MFSVVLCKFKLCDLFFSLTHGFDKISFLSGKLHVTTTFKDVDEEHDRYLCKFSFTAYWAGQFEAMRAGYLGEDDNEGFIRSLSISSSWTTQGGKTKAKFFRSADERFVIKVISKVELQMFLEFAPAYFGI
jgi:1-phosphatidylinositol-3-phosphate 5-kinase